MNPKRMTTKEVILFVASNLFMDKGFLATSTREIAEKAGITQPNLYHHFKTKEAIYIAALEDLSSQVREALEKMVDEPSASLSESLGKILDYLREQHPANFSIMSHDMTYEISEENHYHLYQIWQAAYVTPLIGLFERFTNEDSPFEAKELARYFYSAISPFIQKENRFYKEVTSETIIRLFVYGIFDKNIKEE